MKTIRRKAYARVGLLGNPSDGYNGKTISFVVRNFFAEVALVESDELNFETNSADSLAFKSLGGFSEAIDKAGFYGATRLLKSALWQFLKYCDSCQQNYNTNGLFSVSVCSNIPREVGLAGSSAIVVAAIRSFCDWFNVSIEPHLIATMALEAELELGLNAGLQDRVVQAYDTAVYMDFAKSCMREETGIAFGQYEPIDLSSFENFYVAYSATAAESTNVLHSDLRKRYDSGDEDVIATLNEIAGLAEAGRKAILSRQWTDLSQLIDQNFELRKSKCKLNPFHVKMIETARSVGASAKYCGSGGAIVGVFDDVRMFESLQLKLSEIGCDVIKPILA